MFLFNFFFFFPQHVCWKAGMSEEVDLQVFCLNWPYDHQWSSSSQGPQCPASGQPRWLPKQMAGFFWKAVVQCPQALLEERQGSQELSGLHRDIHPVTTSWSLRVTASRLWARRVLPEAPSWCPVCWLLIQRPEHLSPRRFTEPIHGDLAGPLTGHHALPQMFTSRVPSSGGMTSMFISIKESNQLKPWYHLEENRCLYI